MPADDVAVSPASASAFESDTALAEDVDASPVTPCGVKLANTVPLEEASAHDPSARPTVWNAVTTLAVDTADCPVRAAVEFVLTENAPAELLADEPASVLPLEELAKPCDIAADAPTKAAETPLAELTVPADTAVAIAVNAMDTA